MAGKFHHEAIYRGEDSLATLANARLVICGGGALGSNLMDTLVRQGFRKLRAIDFDRVDEQNIGTQIYDQVDIGQFKVDALRNRMFRAASVEIDAIRKELTASNSHALLKDCDLIVDCFDNSNSRQIVQEHARSSGIPTLHAGLFADYGEVIWDEDYRVPQNAVGDVCDYALARNLVVLTVAVAAETLLSHLLDGRRKNHSVTLRDLAIKPM